MEIQKAKSLDQLYEEVKDYSLVLTAEASTADALNRRIDTVKTGKFATTPQRLAYGDELAEEDFKREIFLKLVNEKGLGWKQTSYLLSNAISCWKETGSLENLEDHGFKGEAVGKVVETLKNTENPLKALENYRVSEERDVAVIAPYQLNNLDRKILPDSYTEISVFTDERWSLPEFNIFNSANGLVQALKQSIEDNGAENIGVVVNPSSGYQTLLESLLEASDIPYLKQQDLSEDEDLRTFLSLMRTGLSSKRVRVKDIKPVLQELNVPLPSGGTEKFVEDLEEGELESFREFFTAMRHLPFEEVVRKYEEFTDRGLDSVKSILEELNIEDETVSEGRINQIEYYLDSFAPSEDIEEDGVLFADPKKVSRVDRPLVFFVGMDADWREESRSLPWINQDKREENNLKDFKSLIQSGKPVFMVQDKEMNEDIKPCFYLNELLEEEFTNFRQLPHKRVKPSGEKSGTGFKRKNLEIKQEKVEALSQSSLNNLAMSPRFYYVSELVSDVDEERLEKGNLFHDYAEFYVNYPEFMEEKKDAEVVEFMLNRIRPYADDLDLEKLETEFKVGIKNIREFVEEKEVSRQELESYEKKDREKNIFSDKYGKPIRSKITEMWFEDKELGGKGKIDFIQNKQNLVDYKSGRKKSCKKIIKKSKIGLHSEERYPNFQAPMYLAYHRKQFPDQELNFTFFHFLENIGEEVAGKASNADKTVELTYFPETFQEKAASNKAFEKLIKDVAKSNDRRKTLEKLGCHQFKDFMAENSPPKTHDKEEMLKSDFAEKFKDYAEKEVGDYKYVRNGVESALKKLVDFHSQNFFKKDIDRFEEFLQQKISELNEYRDSRFPLDANPDDLPDRDLITK
ncbi:MAG: PD-(D/E)XK nuclease family protein [Candidatus Nanohalobium sp.]